MNALFPAVSTLLTVSWLASSAVLASQGASVSADQFREASRATRLEILSRLTTQVASAPTPTELRHLLAEALEDQDSGIRKRALAVVASRAGGPRFSGDAAVRTRAENERPELRLLRGLVIATLSDADAEVRAAAVLAIGNLDAAEGGWARSITLGADTVEGLLAAFRVEQNAAVRVRLVEALAVTTNDLPQAETWWLDLMRDASPDVRQSAARGARKLRASVALPLLVKNLTDPDRGVRLTSAQLIGHFKAAASDLIPTLLDAAERETDPIVQKTLLGTVTLLQAQ